MEVSSSDNPPLVLLIPVFENQDGLTKSLTTLPVDQALDILIVDDGSTSPIYVPPIPSIFRVFLIRHSNNLGVEQALNTGLEWILERDYPYIARLDAGDIVLEGRFKKQVSFLDTHLDYGLVGGQVYLVNEKGQEIFQEFFPLSDTVLYFPNNKLLTYHHQLYRQHQPQPQTLSS